jgi:bifunctional UDP-N-acetylglucosamine pyrophosphorylase/glucosamine-1-phosphate N-acetyltransferase
MNVQQQKPNSTSSGRKARAVILAAGKSTRMKSELPKVMHEVCGRPMLAYVLDACRDAGVDELLVVVGFGKDAVIQAFSSQPGVSFVEQTEQKGTGHAVAMCADAFKGFEGDCVVIAGDMPMIRSQTLVDLLGGHRASGSVASIATTVLEDPTSYGRIVRNAAGEFEKIVEHRDCTPEQLKINEVNPSYYCFDSKTLFASLPKVKTENAKGEYYLTDVLAVLRSEGKSVRACTSVPAIDATGINSRADLAEVSRLMQRRIATQWMDQGVTIVDPETTWIDSRATIGAETIIKPFSYIEGRSIIGVGCLIGPYAYVADGAVVADGAGVGPGLLAAFEQTGGGKQNQPSTRGKQVQVVRRPPAQQSCS